MNPRAMSVHACSYIQLAAIIIGTEVASSAALNVIKHWTILASKRNNRGFLSNALDAFIGFHRVLKIIDFIILSNMSRVPVPRVTQMVC
ncbi:hypothetical protein VISI1226_01025 [Vibrio sinaloensis DSM 21326]|uniref:Uncharacterized protein n=1 Tax=Vibrio sinaloensis DSM 21326 TaxID=945550 RepID=E8M6F4_PHOS4|nr:hypothetical protein [Vibrio sinaloensis]EGA70604.1 hypothetical protein VISI1226_01025 [Vibrio sinaloensis DSM 21326]